MTLFLVLFACLASVWSASATSHTLFYLKANSGPVTGRYLHIRQDTPEGATHGGYLGFKTSQYLATLWFVDGNGVLTSYSSNSSIATYVAINDFGNDRETGYSYIAFMPESTGSPPTIKCDKVSGKIGQSFNSTCNFRDAQPIDGPASWGIESTDNHSVYLFQVGSIMGGLVPIDLRATITGYT